MSYGRMPGALTPDVGPARCAGKKRRAELKAEIEELMARAETVDAEEDVLYGKGKRGDPKSRALRGEIPEELRFRETRLAKIEEAMAALEAEAKTEADAKRAEIAEKERIREEEDKPRRGPKPKEPSDEPEDKAQRNFTDPESRIMVDGATKGFVQAYNCQAAVDADSQVIVAADVTQEANDPKSRALRGKKQVEPMIEQVKSNTGENPTKASADNGYFSEANVEYLKSEEIDGYVASGRTKHGEAPPSAPRGPIPKKATTKERMARKLRTKKGRETYAKRKTSVEPVFGQIKDGRGIRRFLLRGIEAVRGEWRLICLTHNLLKLFRSTSTLAA